MRTEIILGLGIDLGYQRTGFYEVWNYLNWDYLKTELYEGWDYTRTGLCEDWIIEDWII
jgi:hypothetical protein